MKALGTEFRGQQAVGRTPAACPPQRIQMNPRQLLDHLNAIPAAQRARMTSTDGLRHWMAARYPCPDA